MPTAQTYSSADLGFEEIKPASNDVGFEEIKTPRLKKTATESMIWGGLQGASAGYADELGAGVKTAFDVAKNPEKFKQNSLYEIVQDYRKNRTQERARYQQAREDNPDYYSGGEIAGSLATTAIPGLGMASKVGLIPKMIQGAKFGAVAGLGTSESDLTQGDIAGTAEDVGGGAVAGGLTAGAVDVGIQGLKSLTPKNAAKKLANVFLNTPEEITDAYIKNPEAIKTAPRRFEVAQKFEEKGLEGLKKLTTEGSAESRAILKEEGKTLKSSDLAKIYNEKANDILKQSEGIITDPQKMAAYKALKDTADKFKSGVDPDTGRKLPNTLSTNRVKDELQSLDRMTEYGIGPGQFGKVDDTVKKGVRQAIDRRLKNLSPEYEKQMVQVAQDAQLLNEASSLAKSPQGWSNIFKRLETDQYGGGQVPRETLSKVDQRLGTNFLEQGKLATIKEAFDKSITNGSMNVNKFSNMLKDIPYVGRLAPLVGATVDKYGRKLTMSAVDTAAQLEESFQKEGIQQFVRAARPIMNAASQGDPAAAITFQFLSESNPDAIKALEQQEALERRRSQINGSP